MTLSWTSVLAKGKGYRKGHSKKLKAAAFGAIVLADSGLFSPPPE